MITQAPGNKLREADGLPDDGEAQMEEAENPLFQGMSQDEIRVAIDRLREIGKQKRAAAAQNT